MEAIKSIIICSSIFFAMVFISSLTVEKDVEKPEPVDICVERAELCEEIDLP